MLRGAGAGVTAILMEQRIEKLLLRRTLDRFLPRGSNKRAQRGPDGKPWAALSKVTLARRKGNKKGANQALVATSSLMKSIAIVRSNMRSQFAMTSPTGAGFTLGAELIGGARYPRYGRVMQYGGWTPQGKRIPARPFLGISDDDVRAVDQMMQRIMKRSV
jgi:hypothetical protein